MRKFLSLVLALVMVMSLTVVTAGAKDFTDNDTVDYNEAVDVISALNVVDGYADGSFNPTGLLTRQAAAKIICNLILGPTTAASLTASTSPFYDVPTDSGFAGYIAYCAQQGIISGYGDGSFQPGGYLSGNAFMKMLLGALGYDANIEQFVGPNWNIQVGKLAMGLGLTEGLEDSFDGTKTVNRQEAALYAMNTLEATMVGYGQKITITDANGNPQTIGYTDATNLPQTGYPQYTTGGDQVNTLQFCEKYFPDLKKTDTDDDFNRPSHTWKIKTTEVGTYTNSTDLVASWTAKVTKDALYNALGKNVVDDLIASGGSTGEPTLTYSVDGDSSVQVGGSGYGSGITANFAARRDTGKINNDSSDTGNGALTEVYLDKDTGDVDIVTINTYVFQASSDYSSSRDEVKVAAAGDTEIHLDSYTLDGEDFDLSDIKEDDYLLITAYKDGASYKVASVEPAEIVEGEVTAYAEESKVTVDGTEYSYSLKTLKNGGVQSLIQSTGGQVALVMDKYGYVIAVDDTVTSGNYVFVTAAESSLSFTKVIAHAYFADGTVEDINLKKVDGSSNKDNMRGARGWYTYSKDSSDNYSLTSVKGSYRSIHDLTMGGAPVTILSNGIASMTTVNGINNVRANERTIFVIEDTDGDVYTYTGISNAPDIKVTSGSYAMGYVWNRNSGYASYVFISVDGIDAEVDTSTENDQYIFLLKLDSTRNNGTDRYYQYKAIVDGEETMVLTDDTYTVNQLYTKIKVDSNTDRITGMGEVDNGATDTKYHREPSLSGAKVSYKNGVLTIGSEAFVINSDSQLNLIVGENCGALVDQDADYEVYDRVSGATIASVLDGYKVNGSYYVVTKDTYDPPVGNRDVKVLYLYVNTVANAATSDVPAAVSVLSGLSGADLIFDGVSPAMTQAEARQAVLDRIEDKINNHDVKVKIEWGSFLAAVNGTVANSSGTPGSITADVITVSSGNVTDNTTTNVTFTLNPVAYDLTAEQTVTAAKNLLADLDSVAATEGSAFVDDDAAKAEAEAQLNAQVAGLTGVTLTFTWGSPSGDAWVNGALGDADAEAGKDGTYPVTVNISANVGGDTASDTKDVNVTLKAAPFKDTVDGKTALQTLEGQLTTTTATIGWTSGNDSLTYDQWTTALEAAVSDTTNGKVKTITAKSDDYEAPVSGTSTGTLKADVTYAYKESSTVSTTITKTIEITFTLAHS